MKNIIMIILIAGMGSMFCMQQVMAQDIPGVGTVAGLGKRIIKAIDLKIQRMQNQTIWLQNAQKVIENTMSKLHLSEIGNWVQKQTDLYQKYYTELWQVKSYITYYHRVREIADKQLELVKSYKRAWSMLKQDEHFSADELGYMNKVYSGILDATVKNVDQLFLVVSSFTTQMSDAARMEIINNTAAKVDENYSDLTRFNSENAVLSLQRVKDENDLKLTKMMYGLPLP